MVRAPEARVKYLMKGADVSQSQISKTEADEERTEHMGR